MLAGEGRQIAEHGQQRAVQLFRVHLLQAEVVAQQQFGTVDQLQHHEVADFGTADLAVGADALGNRVTTVVEHADDFFQTRQQIAGGVGLNVGRHEIRVEADHTVRRGVEHVADLQLHVGLIALLLAEQQFEVRATAADLAGGIVAGVGVGHFGVVRGVTREHVGLLRTARLDVVTGDQRQRQVDRRVTSVRRYVQRQRLGVATEFEQAAVRQNPRGFTDHQFAHVEELQVDLQIEETPGVTTQQLRAGFHLVIVITIVVLEVLRTQQHAFLPNDFMGIHDQSSALAST